MQNMQKREKPQGMAPPPSSEKENHALTREKLQEYLDIFRADGNCEQLILDEFETLRHTVAQQAQEVDRLRTGQGVSSAEMDLAKQLAASQALVEAFQAGQEEIANVLGWANVHPYTKQTFILNQIAHLQATLAVREGEIEQVRVQLAGCLTAAEGATTEVAKKGDYGWSVAYQETLNLRISYDLARQDAARLREALRFYADPQTYGISGGTVDRIIQDAGKQAQAALKGA